MRWTLLQRAFCLRLCDGWPLMDVLLSSHAVPEMEAEDWNEKVFAIGLSRWDGV